MNNEEQKKINDIAILFLISTDWYIIRKQETGQEIPEEILTARQVARSQIK